MLVTTHFRGLTNGHNNDDQWEVNVHLLLYCNDDRDHHDDLYNNDRVGSK